MGGSKYIQDITQQTGVVGQAVAQRKWNRQHPLPDRNHGKDVVDEMRGRLRHASSPTRRTPAAPAAGKRNKAVVPARIAVDTYKPAGRNNTAGQVVPELAFHKRRNRPLPFLLTSEERFQLFGDDSIEDSCLGIARDVLRRCLL